MLRFLRRLTRPKEKATVPSQPPDTPERRAYREAGHAVMSYLIRQGLPIRARSGVRRSLW